MASATNNRSALVEEFRKFLDAEAILHEQEQLKPYECDGLTAYRQTPLVVVLPETIEQVQQVLRVCARKRVPVVARGAGTGLSGGALPLADGVLLGLAKFNRIHPTRLHKLPAASAATWPRTQAACTVSSTA